MPNKELLKKSSYKNNLAKEINKANNDLAIKLEKTLSEYGVEGKITGYKSGPIVALSLFRMQE